jgi:hypothetical protein
MSSINPWVRANMEYPCPETLSLIPPSEQEEYERILADLQIAGAMLVEARIDEARLAEEKPITRWRGAESEEEVGYQKGISAQINLANRRQNERIQELKASQPINLNESEK